MALRQREIEKKKKKKKGWNFFFISLWRRANARNVRLYYLYWQYTDLFIFRFVSLYSAYAALYVYKDYILVKLRSPDYSVGTVERITYWIKRQYVSMHALSPIRTRFFHILDNYRGIKETNFKLFFYNNLILTVINISICNIQYQLLSSLIAF